MGGRWPALGSSADVWVANDLIRRIEVTADLSDDPADDEVDTTTVDYYDFNADITITPLDVDRPTSGPPPADTGVQVGG